MRTLLAPPGAENFPISFGTLDFKPFRLDHTDPASRWAVTVPDEAAVYFLHNAGFSLMTDAPQSPQPVAVDIARLRHPDGHSCGWDGVAYEPDEEGVVTVPTRAVADLWHHGFRYAVEEPVMGVSVGGAESVPNELRTEMKENSAALEEMMTAREPKDDKPRYGSGSNNRDRR